jgi:putative nucleotidyltransferase with HDIG domain
VNSAIYGRRGTISSVGHALSLLGLNKLRNLALSLSIANLWTRVRTPKTWSGAQFNLHSVATAVLSDQLALRLDVDYAEGAFAAGLLHDLGKLLMAIALFEEYEEIDNLFETGGLTMEECEMEVIGITHAQLSALALAQWNLPKQVQEAVAYHHRPDPPRSHGVHLSRVVQAADAFANNLGVTLAPTTAETSGSAIGILEELGVATQALELTTAFKAEFETIQSFF